MWRMTRRRLRILRKRLGLSVAAAAAQVHVSIRTWFRWESGDLPVPDTAAHLFCLLNGEAWIAPAKRKVSNVRKED